MPGALRVPRTGARTSPYRHSRSLSPDPSFQASLLVPKESKRDSKHFPPRNRDTPVLLTSTQPRIISRQVITGGSNTSESVAPNVLMNSNEREEASEPEDKIPKPPGEAGKPSRGGYNLRIQLGWADTRFDDVENFMNEVVGKKLDCAQSFSEQSLADIQEIQNMALKRYPFLKEYHDNWVADEFIKSALKRHKKVLPKGSSTARSRRKRFMETAED
ncbi:hypothetical protein EV361DRAFT_271583 [Lentinula raphanica]|nr:hypothetical protein EV361DRAFT_271583 [Lentinula raphanica]